MLVICYFSVKQLCILIFRIFLKTFSVGHFCYNMFKSPFTIKHWLDFFYRKNAKVQKRGKINLIGRLQLTTERMREEENEGIVQLRILRTQVCNVKTECLNFEKLVCFLFYSWNLFFLNLKACSNAFSFYWNLKITLMAFS